MAQSLMRHHLRCTARSIPQPAHRLSARSSSLQLTTTAALPDAQTDRHLAIITGGSRGLGFCIAQQLVLAHQQRGLDLVLLAQNSSRLQEACQQLMGSQQGRVRVVGHALDLGNIPELTSALPLLTSGPDQGGWLPAPPATYDSVLLVHNAGTTGKLQWSWEMELHDIRREMDLNVVSPTAITAAVTSAFIRMPRCRDIVVANISSVSATQPYECFGVYAAGKAARLMLSRTLAREADLIHNPGVQAAQQQGSAVHADANAQIMVGEQLPRQPSAGAAPGPVLRSISYAPGALDTDMQAAAREALPDEAPLKAAFQSNVQNKRLVDPAVSAKCLVQLLSGPHSAWENGAHLSVYDLLPARAEDRTIHHPLDYSKE